MARVDARAQVTLVLLPGMDGTGELFGPLLGVIPASYRCVVVSYPRTETLNYARLLGVVERALSKLSDVVLIAESFSGPLAVRYAAEHPQKVRGCVLCASFVTPPVPRMLGFVASAMVQWVGVPKLLVRRMMLGGDARDDLVASVQGAIQSVRRNVMATRLREVMRVDCRDALRSVQASILFLTARNDRLCGKRSLKKFYDIRSDIEVKTLNGPHLLLQREPVAAWGEIEGFVQRVAGS